MRAHSRVERSRAKKLVFGLSTAAVVLLLGEGLLALVGVRPVLPYRDPFVGFERSIPLYVERQDATGRRVLATARNKLDYFNPQQFPQRKPDGTVRVFCLGGSTTFGRPYDDTTSFPGWLRELLSEADPQQHWEVINAGGISYASYRVAALMEELVEYAPDVFIVYTGHNEFLEHRTYGRILRTPVPVRRLNRVLSHTRTYSWMQSWWTPAPRRSRDRPLLPAEVDAMLDRAAGPSMYRRDDRLRQQVVRHFEYNLARMTRLARDAGADLIYVNPAANLRDFSPFKSEFSGGLDAAARRRWLEEFEEGRRQAEAGHWDEAAAAFAAAAALDDRHAELHYRWGRALFAGGHHEEARTVLWRAVDEDVCALRVLPDMQRAIERVAVASRAPLVDFDAILRNDCRHHYGHDVPGREYFLDHVHPTVAANRMLALALVEAMRQRGWVAPGESVGEAGIARVTERIEARVDVELQCRALRNLAQVLSWAGKQPEAGPLAVEAVRLREEHGLSDDPESLFYAGVHLALRGDSNRAIDFLRRVVESQPAHVQARWRLGLLLFEQQRYRAARAELEKAVRLDPGDPDIQHLLGKAALRSDAAAAALPPLRAAARLRPNDAEIDIDLARALQRLGREDEASEVYQRVLRVKPDSVSARRALRELADDPSP